MERLKSLWPFGKADESKTKSEADDSKNLRRICDLPLYPQPDDLSQWRFVEDDPLPLQKSISTIRVAVQKNCSSFKEQFGSVQRAIDGTQRLYRESKQYLQEEGTILPKAVAITIGGMTGFLLGIRRGGILRQVAYSGTGMVVMAAFCYPRETVDIGRAAFRSSRSAVTSAWSEFKEPPPPPPTKAASKPKKVEGDAAEDTASDHDLYTTRSEKT